MSDHLDTFLRGLAAPQHVKTASLDFDAMTMDELTALCGLADTVEKLAAEAVKVIPPSAQKEGDSPPTDPPAAEVKVGNGDGPKDDQAGNYVLSRNNVSVKLANAVLAPSQMPVTPVVAKPDDGNAPMRPGRLGDVSKKASAQVIKRANVLAALQPGTRTTSEALGAALRFRTQQRGAQELASALGHKPAAPGMNPFGLGRPNVVPPPPSLMGR